MISVLRALHMDSDNELLTCLDWDPVYLAHLFSEDFNDMSSLWNSEIVSDSEMLKINVESEEKYQPVIEDISLEDDMLHDAVNRIEAQ